jgi:SAM-dependent methyltransferase
MAHQSQRDYFFKIKNKFPNLFRNQKVLDVGSLDINGNNRMFFDNCEYYGLDVAPGPNVDIICYVHEHKALDGEYGAIISGSCFEHDRFYKDSLKQIVRMLKPGGIFLCSVPTTGYPEHGTRRIKPEDAPLLTSNPDWEDYYKNLTEDDIREAIDVDAIFSEYKFEICYQVDNYNDLFFYGIKRR